MTWCVRIGKYAANGATVDHDLAGAGAQAHARDRLLAATGGLDEGLGHERRPSRAGRRARAGRASGSGRVDRLLRLVRMRRAGVDLELLQHLRGRAGPSAACASPRAARPSRGRARAGARGSRCGCRPGSRCGGGTACRSPLRGEIASFDALMTITWSPVSTCGAQIGLCLPRSSVAISVARRPRMAPSASITCHCRVMSDGSGRERAHGASSFEVDRRPARGSGHGRDGQRRPDGQTGVAAPRALITSRANAHGA